MFYMRLTRCALCLHFFLISVFSKATWQIRRVAQFLDIMYTLWTLTTTSSSPVQRPPFIHDVSSDVLPAWVSMIKFRVARLCMRSVNHNVSISTSQVQLMILRTTVVNLFTADSTTVSVRYPLHPRDLVKRLTAFTRCQAADLLINEPLYQLHDFGTEIGLSGMYCDSSFHYV